MPKPEEVTCQAILKLHAMIFENIPRQNSHQPSTSILKQKLSKISQKEAMIKEKYKNR